MNSRTEDKLFDELTAGIRAGLSEHFNTTKYPNLKVTAEPGSEDLAVFNYTLYCTNDNHNIKYRT